MSLRIYGNRLLKTLPGKATRPTPARVREALFNIWQGQLVDSVWLDLCAGSGAMGAEALCRGVTRVVGIEQSAAACRVIQENWQRLASGSQTFQILRGDVRVQVSRLAGQTFSHIYFDPPYSSNLYAPVLAAIAQHHLLSEAGELAVEHRPTDWQPITFPGLTLIREKRYGSTAIAFYSVEQKLDGIGS